MADARNIFSDMSRQRRIQAAAGLLAIAGVLLWLAGVWPGEYVTAVAIILFAVATIHRIDDKEAVEEEQLQRAVADKK